jgi:crossover junction endodeoxyribonuclease RuvC
VIECGVLRLGTAGSFAERLAELQRGLVALVERLEPTVAAVEAPFHGASARSALRLAHARGVVLAAVAAAGIEVVEYSPASVKKAVTGSGRADKEQVARMVSRLVGGHLAQQPHDLTDAVAVALCHLATAGFAEAVRRARVDE